MDKQKLSIELVVEDWNYIMGVLSQRPFAEVVNLIAVMKSQADGQLSMAPAPVSAPVEEAVDKAA